MIAFITAMAASAAVQTAQPAPINPHAQHPPQGGQMDHSKMGHSDRSSQGGSCCTKTANGKMECQMMKGAGSDKAGHGEHQGHSSH